MTKPFNKILLAHAFFLKNDSKQLQDKVKPYPPLATLYAAGLLRNAGYQVALFDAMLAQDLAPFEDKITAFKPDMLLIVEDSFHFLSKMCLSHVRETSREMINFARELNLPVLINSADSSDVPHIYLDFGADYVIRGEIESSLMQLFSYLQNPAQADACLPSRVISQGSGTSRAQKHVKERNLRALDKLPPPAWDLVDFAAYREIWQAHHGYLGINMVTTRGCPYRCNWCAKPVWGQQYVSHSPAYIVQQLIQLVDIARPEHIWFADDIFGLRNGWIEEYAHLLNQENIRIPYMIQSRADLINESMVQALSDSGCTEVWLGVESGSQKILDAMDKDLKLSEVKQARRLLKQVGIKTGFFIQLGYLGEEIADLNATRELITGLLPDEIGVSVSYPLPGTGFYDKIRTGLFAKDHWQESKDLEVVFNANYSSDFYRRIRNHLHRELKALRNAPHADTRALWQNRWQQLMNSAEQHKQAIPVSIKERHCAG
ncbi:B12-binding domain-containing radical SAM protein [Thalassomonas viridans]|uniref:B12-binding domain-containing radical SAM protein n=1 Tax=Thalassomonas viridans TaxID=137584 RepID=A0AAE9Z7E4_9GAMM|nr:radical SAM protein [Thalassomonas viridans]WDE07908.1 B12-binding domain-containing radical SAM protein [Thalassomonas viridans]